MNREDGHIGKRHPRADARRLVTGSGTYLDDVQLAGALHVVFVRSPHAHARIVGINTSAAAALPGVVRVVTGADLRPMLKPMRVAMPALGMAPGLELHALAVDEACWHGAPVAAVVARTRGLAEDAAELVDVEYEELPAVVDSERALDEGAARAVEALESNLAFEHRLETGDVERCFREAAAVVEHHFVFDRQTGVPLESRGIIASFAPIARELLVHQSHQAPFQMRDIFADLLGLDVHKIRVICNDVGGAFGMKLHCYPDELAVVAIAVLLGRRVKFVADRFESFLSDSHAREAVADARLALDADGRFTAFDVTAISGLGAFQAYPRGSVGEGLHMVQLVGSPYRFEAFRSHLRSVYQNKVPTGAYRGVGQPLGCTITETLVDLAAFATGRDPAELRRLNYLQSDRADPRTPAGLSIGKISLQPCLDQLLELMNYAALRDEQEWLRKEGVYRGIGIATFVELTGVASMLYGANEIAAAAAEGCTVRLESSGTLLCHSSATDQGQGILAGVAQIVAQVFDLPIDAVTVRAGDTGFAPVGGGAWASRGMAIGGQAALMAAQDLRRHLLDLAARLFGLTPDLLDLRGGNIHEKSGAHLMTLREFAAILHFRQFQLPGGVCPQLSMTRHYVPEGIPYIAANGIQGCYLEVDVETGMIRLLRHWVVDDCGRIINPLLVDEQIRGGVAQGIGGALYEHCEYSDSGQLSNCTLADYLVPMAGELPDIEIGHVSSVASETELGAKGVGEAGTIGAGAVIWNAVNDAIHPLGAVMRQQPFTPDRVLRALASAAL